MEEDINIDSYVDQKAREGAFHNSSTVFSLERVNEGEASNIWVYNVGGYRIVLKRTKTEDRWKNLSREFNVLKAIEFSGLAPKPIFFDSDKSILCYEYVGGQELESETARNNIETIAKKAREVHSIRLVPENPALKLSNYKTFFDFPLELERYVRARMDGIEEILNRERLDILKGIVDTSIRRLHECAGYFGGSLLSFSHKDFKPWNLVLEPSGNVKPIDWNFADMCDPAFDLCLFARSSDLSQEQLQFFLAAYGSDDEDLRSRVEAYMDFCRTPCIIWHVDKLMNPKYSLSPERSAEYRKYSGRYLREMIQKNQAGRNAFKLIC